MPHDHLQSFLQNMKLEIECKEPTLQFIVQQTKILSHQIAKFIYLFIHVWALKVAHQVLSGG